MFADLRGRPVLVVGGGVVAERKVQALRHAGARVRVGAPALTPALRQAAEQGAIEWWAGSFEPGWLQPRTWLVIAATADAGVNQAVAAAAEAQGIFANVVDDAALSSFQVPALVERGALQVAISTGGGAPVVARHLRRWLESLLDDSWGGLVDLFGRQRARIRARFPDTGARRRFFQAQLAGPLPRLLRDRRPADAARYLEAQLAQPAAPERGSVVLVVPAPAIRDC